VTRGKDVESGEVEWIGFGPQSEPELLDSGGFRWRWWYALLVAVVLAAFVIVRLNHRSGHPSAAGGVQPTASPSSVSGVRSPSPSTPVSAPIPAPASAQTAVVGSAPDTVNVGHSLLDVPADWELFGQGLGSVVRIQLRAGVIMRTSAAILDNGGPLSFVVGPDRAIVRPYDSVPGYVVPDGQAPQRILVATSQIGPVLPGPDRSHYWSTTNADGTMTLVGFDGTATKTVVKPPANSYPISDGAGYLMFTSTSGVYQLRPNGIHRITTGTVLATGPSKWLIAECDDTYHCSTYVVDRGTGVRRVIAANAAETFAGTGAISPDGSVAALMEASGGGGLTLHLIDLATGADRSTGVSIDLSLGFGEGTFVWSPDNRWLFAAGQGQKMIAIDARSGQITNLDADAHVTQVALRTANG
jgi:hypothetical protein